MCYGVCMIRSALLALMFSGSVFALSTTAYAQTSPDTRQTDQSEEDWRKSKKKGSTSSEDILDIIKNTRSSGVGNGRGYSPIDALPEESRRHLMKERAKRMAQAGPNEPVDATYTPSEAAKSDTNLQNDEKAAWKKMAQGMNGTPVQGAPGQGQQQGSDSGSQGQQGQQQGSDQSSDPSAQSGQSRSVMRGGSAASVSDIMARIKGLSQGQGQGNGNSSGSTGQGPSGQSSGQQGQQGQSQQGGRSGSQSQQGGGQSGQSPSQQGQQSGQSRSQQAQNQSQQQGQTTRQSQQEQQSQSNPQSDTQKQAKAEAQAEAASNAHAIAHAPDSSQAASSTRTPEAISPLDRIKKVNQEQDSSGSRSSASDYLKKKE